MFTLSPYDEGGKLVSRYRIQNIHVGLYEYPSGDSSDCDTILMDWLNGPDMALYQLSQCTVLHIPPQTLTESDRYNFTLCFCFEKTF